MKKYTYELGEKTFVVFETRWAAILPTKLVTEDIDVKQIKKQGQTNRDILLLLKVPFLQSGKLYMTVEFITDILRKYYDEFGKTYVDNFYRIRDAQTYDELDTIYEWYYNTALELLKRERPDLYDMWLNYDIQADPRTGILDSNHAFVLRAIVFMAKFMVLPLLYWPDYISETNKPNLDYNTELTKKYTLKLFGKHENLYNNILLLVKAIARGRFSAIFEKLEAMNKTSIAEEEVYTLYHLLYSALLQLSEDAQSLGTVTRIIQSKYLVVVRESADYNIKPVDTLSTNITLKLPTIISISHNLREALIQQAYLLSTIKALKEYMPSEIPPQILPLSKNWFTKYVVLPVFYKHKNIKQAPDYILKEEMLHAIHGYTISKQLLPHKLTHYVQMLRMAIPIKLPFTELSDLKKNRKHLVRFLTTLKQENTFAYSTKGDKVFLLLRDGTIKDIQFVKILEAYDIQDAYKRFVDMIPEQLQDILIPYLQDRLIELAYGRAIDIFSGRVVNVEKTDLMKAYINFLLDQFDIMPFEQFLAESKTIA